MSVGNQATPATINAALTAYATQLRDLCFNIGNLQNFVNGPAGLGATGLENLGGAGMGFSSADAAVVLSMASYLNTFNLLFNGEATQSSEFDFDNALAPLYAAG